MKDHLLKHALYANASFSAGSTLVIILFTDELSGLFAGLPQPYLQALAAGLFLFAGAVYWVARKSPINIQEAKLITLADWGWVAGSILLVLATYNALTILAIDLILGVAVVVAGFAIAQMKGIKRLMADKEASFSAP